MSLQYMEPTPDSFPIGIFARAGGGGNQRPGTRGQGAGKPALKKATKKKATKKKATKKAATKRPAKKKSATKKKK